MPLLTLNQAAKEAKKAKSTLLEAIQSGRLSAVKNDTGQWQIDPAELFRVYPPDQTEGRTENRDRPSEEPEKTAFLLEKIRHLEDQLKKTEAERERERAQLQAQIEREQAQIKREQEQADHWRQQATNLLTHHEEPKAEPTESPLFKKIFRGWKKP
ncbi:hypothetical protein [Methylocucumis oryzae]|uniref:Helix-turn-helix domain-containing protein n=1 Tax=Methylocucumis oryzae TaxID=1632867 RepID=A0A0F3IDT2_9GAMM|nr:hypothetical protein [Methylocucumis oryzae]KJV04965.1 hypothetical protein VZ94_21650 [Methylocucumis oryzae]